MCLAFSEAAGAQRHRALGDHEEGPAVHRVGDRASRDRADERGQELDEADEPDVERRSGQPVDLVADRDDPQLPAAGLCDGEADPEPTEVPEAPHRRDVDEESGGWHDATMLVTGPPLGNRSRRGSRRGRVEARYDGACVARGPNRRGSQR